MSSYKRTELGDQELLQRKLRLSARVRTLLLLLESEDLKQLSTDAFEKIANPQNYQTLLDLNLIVDLSGPQVSKTVEAKPVQTIQHPTHQVTPVTPVQNTSVSPVLNQASVAQHPAPAPAQAPVSLSTSPQETEPAPLSFVEIKLLMQHTLKQYCGLMAKNLVNAIEQSNSTHEIRQHQSKWLTTLFETRISRQQLNELLQIINHSMDKIEIGKQSS